MGVLDVQALGFQFLEAVVFYIMVDLNLSGFLQAVALIFENVNGSRARCKKVFTVKHAWEWSPNFFRGRVTNQMSIQTFCVDS